MGKKVASTHNQAPRRISTRTIKKTQRPQDEEFYEEDDSPENSSSHLDREQQDEGQDSDADGSAEDSGQQGDSDEEEQSQSTPQIDPSQLAIRNMEFRERRGTKMNYLISRKKEEEQDPFWAEQGMNYFGDLDDGDNDEEDYAESSSGRDEFDSDFGQTESEPQEKQVDEKEQKQVDEDRQRLKKRHEDLMRKIQAPAPPKKGVKTAVATPSSAKKQAASSSKPAVELSTRYIHQIFKQEQLLGEAATTEYFNWLSLKKLISLQTEKKDFTKREHHVQGPKIIYRDSVNGSGERSVSYELDDVVVQSVRDLSKYYDN